MCADIPEPQQAGLVDFAAKLQACMAQYAYLQIQLTGLEVELADYALWWETNPTEESGPAQGPAGPGHWWLTYT